MGALHLYLRAHPVGLELHTRLLRFYKYMWHFYRGADQRSVFATAELPPALQQEVCSSPFTKGAAVSMPVRCGKAHF